MMGAEVFKNRRISYEEYLQLEAQDEVRYEYYDGEIVAMAGVSLNHGSIAVNISRFCYDAIEQCGCRMFQSDVKLEYNKSNSILYPDILITCNAEDIQSPYSVKKPLLIAEILSPFTENKDRGEKLAIYCAIPSLRYYLLINQNKPYVEVYSRDKSLAVFQYRMFQEMSDMIEFPELQLTLSLDQIYRNVRMAMAAE